MEEEQGLTSKEETTLVHARVALRCCRRETVMIITGIVKDLKWSELMVSLNASTRMLRENEEVIMDDEVYSYAAIQRQKVGFKLETAWSGFIYHFFPVGEEVGFSYDGAFMALLQQELLPAFLKGKKVNLLSSKGSRGSFKSVSDVVASRPETDGYQTPWCLS